MIILVKVSEFKELAMSHKISVPTLQVYKPVGFLPLIGSDPLANTTGGLLAYDQFVATGLSQALDFVL
jgi:hypothetical protein